MTPAALTKRPGATLLASAVGIPVVIVLMLLAFLTPSINSGAKDLPLAVAAPEAAQEQLSTALETAAPGAFDITFVDDADAVTDSVTQRETIGGIVMSAEGTEVIIASGAGSPYAALLQNLATGLQAQQAQAAAEAAQQAQAAQVAQAPAEADAAAPVDATTQADAAAPATQAPVPTVTVTDVAPLTADDPMGVGLTSLALPLVFGGMASGVLLSIVVKTSWWKRALTAVTVAGLGALLAVVVLQNWFGAISGSFALAWAGLTLGISAISLTLLGLQSTLGVAGLGAGAVTMLFVSNPLSGIATGWQWLPAGWGTVGQMMPVGAAGTILRSAAYFDGAGMGSAPWVLLAWCACGLALLVLGTWLKGRKEA